MTRRHWILIAIALLLVLLLILLGRWMLRDAPRSPADSDLEPQRDELASKSSPVEPPQAESISDAAAPESKTPVVPDTIKAAEPHVDADHEVNAAPPVAEPAAEKLIVNYGAQVFVAGTIEEYRLVFNGSGQAHERTIDDEKYLSVERYLFVADESSRGHELEPGAIVRTYTSCGIDTNGRSVGMVSTHGGEPTLDVRNARASNPSELTDLVHLQARKGPTGAIVVAVRGQPNSDWSATLWDLGLSTFLPDRPVVPGSRWTIPAASFAQILSPGGDLRFHPLEHEKEELASITPGGTPTQKQLGSLTGDSVATYEGEKRIGSRDCHEALIAINVSGKSDDETLGGQFLEHLFTPNRQVKSTGTVKLTYSFEGNGVVAWHEGDARPPISEIRCTFTTDVEMHLDAEGTKIDCVYRVHGQFAFLGGMPTKNDTYWDRMWLPREKFLARESFVIQ